MGRRSVPGTQVLIKELNTVLIHLHRLALARFKMPYNLRISSHDEGEAARTGRQRSEREENFGTMVVASQHIA